MSLKKKIKKGQLTIGSWITIGHPTIAEIMAKAGFDWLAIDMEHGPLSHSQCQELIRVIDLCGLPALVRIGANNPLLIKRALDAGAHGVIVPMVNTVEQAQAAVRAAYYPPFGKRGVGLARAQKYGQDFHGYKKFADQETVVIIQIEDVAAMDQLEDIFHVKGVDAYIIGPYDLSGSLGFPGDFQHPKLLKIIETIHKTARKCKLPSGFHVVSSDETKVREKIDQGHRFIAYAVDFLFLGDSIRRGVKYLKTVKK